MALVTSFRNYISAWLPFVQCLHHPLQLLVSNGTHSHAINYANWLQIACIRLPKWRIAIAIRCLCSCLYLLHWLSCTSTEWWVIVQQSPPSPQLQHHFQWLKFDGMDTQSSKTIPVKGNQVRYLCIWCYCLLAEFDQQDLLCLYQFQCFLW